MNPIDKFTEYPHFKDIQELPEEERKSIHARVAKEDKLLEYIEQVGCKYCPSVEWDDEDNEYYTTGTTAPYWFKRRYNEGMLNANFKYKDYIDNKDIQGTLQALNIDIEKFWYLLLFVSDYIVGCCLEGYKYGDTPREMIQNIIKAIDGNINHDNSTGFHFTKKLTLTLSIEGKRSPIVVENPIALAYLSYLCSLEPEEVRNSNKTLDSATIIAKTTDAEGDMAMITLFTRMLRYFLIDVLPKSDTKVTAYTTVSLNKMLLISRLVYLTKLSTNPKFTGYDKKEDKLCQNYLKDYIKGYKDYEIKRTNTIYE